MTPQLIVLGGGGHAKVLIEACRKSSVAVLGVTDRDLAKVGFSVLGVPVIGDDSALSRHPPESVHLVNGLGSTGLPRSRTALYERCKELGYSFAAVVHPSAVLASDLRIGEGAQLMAGAVVQPGCGIGRNAIVNTNAAVDHDCIIGDHVHLAPGVTLSGGVRVGRMTHIGAGATVIQGVSIGEGCLVAAGAVVVSDVPDGATYAGVPAREARR